MAANEVKLTIRIAEDGKNLDIIAKKSREAAAGIAKVSNATEQANKTRNTYNRQEKGVAGLTSNSTKAFAKQAQTIGGGLVPAYATLAANVFAITAAFNALRQAQATELLAQGLDRVGDAAGRNLPYVAERLKEITGAAISTQQAMEAVALGTSSGFSQEQLEGLAKVAAGASKALGRDMADALSRLTRGAAKLEPEILDELGIIVRLDDAAATYGAQIGKTADQLSILERRQAFVNAILDDGLKKYSDISETIDPNAYDQLAASFDELAKAFLNLINKGAVPLIELLAGNKTALTGATVLFGSTISKQMVPALYNGAKAAADSAFALRKQGEALQANITTTGNLPKVYKDLSKGIQEGTATQSDFGNALTSLNRSLSVHTKQLAVMEGRQATDAASLEAKRTKINEVTAARNTLIKTMQLQATSSAKQGVANATEAASTLNLVEAYKLVKLSIMDKIAAEKLSLVSGTATLSLFQRIKIGAFAAAASVRVLGTAFLAAIPFIGQIIFVGSLLLDWFRSQSQETNELEEKTNKAVASFENFASVAKLLESNLAAGIMNPLITEAKALNGVYDEIRSRVKEVQDAFASLNKQRLTDIKTEIDSLNKKLNQPVGLFDFFLIAAGVDVLQEAREKIQELVEERDNLTKKVDANFIDVESTKQTIQGAIENLKVFGDRTLEARGRLLTFSRSLREDMTPEEVNASLDSIGAEYKRLVNAVTNTTDAFGRFLQESAKFGARQVTPFDTMINEAAVLEDQLASLSETNALAVISTQGATFNKIFGESRESVSATVKEAIRLRDAIAAAPGEVQKLEGALKAVSGATGESAVALEKSLTLQNQIVDRNIQRRQDEIDLIDLLTASAEETARIKQLNEEIEGLGSKKVSQEIIAAQVRVQEVKDEQRLLGIQERIASARQAQARAQQEIARASLVLMNAQDPTRQDISVRAKQEKDLFDQEYVNRINLVNEQNNIRLSGIKAEYDLLEAQAQLLRQRLVEANLSTEGIDNYISKLEGAEQQALDTQNATTAAALLKLAQQRVQNQVTTEQAILSASGTGESTSERLRNMAEQGGLSELDTVNEKVAAARQALAPMLEDLKGLGPQGEYINSIAQGAFVIADSFTMAFESSAKGMQKAADVAKAVGDSIGAVNSIIQSGIQATIAQIDKEIAAEKKRDGKSSDSLAKIQAMERKKEQQQRKAFETNKKMMMAQTVANTAAAVMGALGNQPWTPGNFALAALVGAIGAAQLAIIAGTSFEGGGGGSSGAGTPTSISLGERKTSVDTATSQSAAGELAYFRGAAGTGGPENFQPSNAFAGMKYRANGGNTGVMVGEQGPELFVPDRPGRIVPSDEVQQSSVSNINFSINAVDAAGVEEVLINQRGNIIGMLREAANAHGQEFLEAVDVSVYAAPDRRTL